MRSIRSGITVTLRIGTIPTASTTSSLVLSAFCSDHPMAKVQIRSQLPTSELYRRLRISNRQPRIADETRSLLVSARS
jgi:hypothetical protein